MILQLLMQAGTLQYQYASLDGCNDCRLVLVDQRPIDDLAPLFEVRLRRIARQRNEPREV